MQERKSSAPTLCWKGSDELAPVSSDDDEQEEGRRRRRRRGVRGRTRGGGCGAVAGGVFRHPLKLPFHCPPVAASSWREMTSPLHGGLLSRKPSGYETSHWENTYKTMLLWGKKKVIQKYTFFKI